MHPQYITAGICTCTCVKLMTFTDNTLVSLLTSVNILHVIKRSCRLISYQLTHKCSQFSKQAVQYNPSRYKEMRTYFLIKTPYVVLAGLLYPLYTSRPVTP